MSYPGERRFGRDLTNISPNIDNSIKDTDK